MFKSNIKPIFTLILISVLLISFYVNLVSGKYLHFSDGAKYADVARNIVVGDGYVSDFSFFNINFFRDYQSTFSARGIPLAMPYSIALFFVIFGVSDLSVMATSALFYVCLVLSVYLLGKLIFNKVAGFTAALAVAFDLNFLDYATSGASEPLFALVTVISAYLLFLKTKVSNILFFLSLVLIYFIRPQGIVFILSLVFAWLIYNFSFKKAFVWSLIAVVAVLMFDKFILYPLSFKIPVYPVVTRGVQALFQYSPSDSVSNALRGEMPGIVSWTGVVKKTFYNLYNFYKLLPQISSPYLWALFFVGITLWNKNSKKENVYKFYTTLVVFGSFLLAALTIPFFRYLHPAVTFVYILACGTIVKLFEYLLPKKSYAKYLSLFLVAIFMFGQTLGVIFLDSRFSRKAVNIDKPPIYVEMAKVLKENSKNNDLIVTNLDTWATWYGDRKTVWFPLSPSLLVDKSTGQIPFNAIFLADYLIDDQNYFMGNDWRQIFDNPNDISKWTCEGCREISKKFELLGEFRFPANTNYQNIDSRAILLVKKR